VRLIRIVTKALRKDREQRYQVVKDLLLDLKSLKEELEFQAKLDHSLAPSENRAASATAAPSQTVPTAGAAPETTEVKTSVATHSFSAEVKRHKTAAVLLGAILFVATIAGIVGIYKWPGRGGTQSPGANEGATVVKTTQATYSPGLDQFPSLSPDGNSLAYTSDQKLALHFDTIRRPLRYRRRQLVPLRFDIASLRLFGQSIKHGESIMNFGRIRVVSLETPFS
jgi:hypothetical protein